MLALMDWIVQRWALLAIALTCFGLLLMAILVLAKYVRICLNVFVDTPPPLSMNPVDFQRLEGEGVRFRSFDGTSLQGMHLRPPKGQAYQGTIVFCHEYGSDLYSCARYCRPLLEAGYAVFSFDFRAHGESSGADYKPLQWPSDKELGDVLGACAHVEATLAAEGKPTQVGLFGISRGAGAGLLAASSDPNIKAIVCDGAFSTDTTLIALDETLGPYLRQRLPRVQQSPRHVLAVPAVVPDAIRPAEAQTTFPLGSSGAPGDAATTDLLHPRPAR